MEKYIVVLPGSLSTVLLHWDLRFSSEIESEPISITGRASGGGFFTTCHLPTLPTKKMCVAHTRKNYQPDSI